jgi:uncharacterized protein YndB with AHSA1/START domain/DNA-binding transcriptional ArsR family regulator
MDLVFKALAAQTRRELLDELFRSDGQTLHALAARFDMTRVAVAKHLRLLEEAGLVVTRRHGREKLHHLNPVPIRLVHDRWVSKYTEAWVADLADLKRDLEATVEKVFEIYIRTTPQRLWQAITDPEIRSRYQFGARIESTWADGSDYEVVHRHGGRRLVDGVNLEVDPPHRLVQSYRAVWDDDIATQATSRVTWEIEQVGDSCRLIVVHDQLADDADPHVYGGWPMILSGLKTWLETGEELTTPGSQLYGQTS